MLTTSDVYWTHYISLGAEVLSTEQQKQPQGGKVGTSDDGKDREITEQIKHAEIILDPLWHY